MAHSSKFVNTKIGTDLHTGRLQFVGRMTEALTRVIDVKVARLTVSKNRYIYFPTENIPRETPRHSSASQDCTRENCIRLKKTLETIILSVKTLARLSAISSDAIFP